MSDAASRDDDGCDSHESSSSESENETLSKAIVAKGTIGVQVGFAAVMAPPPLEGWGTVIDVFDLFGTRKSASSDEHDEARDRTSSRDDVAVEKVESIGEGSADASSRSGKRSEVGSTVSRASICPTGAPSR